MAETVKRKADDDTGKAPSPKRVRTSGDVPIVDEQSHHSTDDPKEHAPPVNGGPKVITAASLASIPRAKKAVAPIKPITSRRSPNSRRRLDSPGKDSPFTARRERRTSPLPRQRTPSPKPLRRSPSPGDRSPPRIRKLPGVGARVNIVEREALKKRQEQREQERRIEAQREAAARGVHDVVRQHYNAVPQRGVDWRKTDSKIKGLRSLNNWIKSAVIQKFSPNEGHDPGARQNGYRDPGSQIQGLRVLDIGCGKGGDLQKWNAAPQNVGLYVGLDPAEVSIDQGRGRYEEMRRGGQRGRDRRPLFQAEFIVKDCFGSWLGDIPVVRTVGIDGGVGPDGDRSLARFGGGGFDVVSMMFCMHYAFENEVKARMMLRNVAGSLNKGGRFLGVIPNSDVIVAKLAEFNANRGVKPVIEGEESDDEWDPEKPTESKPVAPDPTETNGSIVNGDKEDVLEWGNDIYRVRIPNAARLPTDGIFRPPFGWKYFYFLEEAVEEVPEYIVPWEAFRAMAVDYDLELQYKKPFNEVWEAEQHDRTLGPLSERMGVVDRETGKLKVSPTEMDAAGFYTAFCFYKV